MSDHASHHDDHDDGMHITPLRTYMVAGAVLMILTVLTVLIDLFVNFGVFNDIFALGVAVAKALVIIVIFMHGRQTSGISRLMMGVGIVWFLILVLGVMDDYLTRGWLPTLGK